MHSTILHGKEFHDLGDDIKQEYDVFGQSPQPQNFGQIHPLAAHPIYAMVLQLSGCPVVVTMTYLCGSSVIVLLQKLQPEVLDSLCQIPVLGGPMDPYPGAAFQPWRVL